MAVTIPGLAIKIDVDAANVARGITAVSTSITASMMVFDRAVSIGSRALAQFAESANRLGPITDLSDKIAISTETLMAWGSAAEFSGGSLEALATGALKYQAVLGDAILGNKTAQATFDRLGLSASQLAGMSSKQGILAVADSLNSMSSAARRAAGIDVFGKGFNEIDLFLRDIRESEAEAERLGITLSRDVIDRIKAVNDNSTLIGKQFSSIGDRIKADLAPAINVVLKDTQDWLAAVKDGGGWLSRFGNLSGNGAAPQDTANNLRALAEAASPYQLWKGIFTGKGAISELIKGQGVNEGGAAAFFDRVNKESEALNSDSSRKAVGALIGRNSARLGAIISSLSQSATSGVASAMQLIGSGNLGQTIAQKLGRPEFAGALEQGTAAAYAAAYQRDQKNKAEEKIAASTKDTAKNTSDLLTWTKRLVNKLPNFVPAQG